MNQPISIARYGLAYLYWAISVALAFVALLVWRETAFIILGMTSWDRYAEHALNQFGFLFIAIAMLSVIIFAEYYYRNGVQNGLVTKRFFRVALIQVLLVLIAHTIQWLGGIVLNFPASPVSPIVIIGEIVIAILLFILYKRTVPSPPALKL